MNTIIRPQASQMFQVLTYLHRMVPPVPAKVIGEFEQVLHKAGFVQPFDEPAFQLRGAELYSNPQLLSGCALMDLLRLITLHVRKERFSEGNFEEVIQSGYMLRLLVRLREVVESGGPMQAGIADVFQDFCRVVERTIPEHMDQPGSTLFSTPDTLVPGRVMLMGTNPGGSASRETPTIRANLDFRRRNPEHHVYVRSLKGTVSKLAKQLQWCVGCFGMDMRRVPAINLTFGLTIDARSTDYPAGATKCWPIHEWLIQRIQPRVLIVFGNSSRSPFQFIRSHVLSSKPKTDDQKSGHGDVRIRSFDCRLAGVDLRVVGIPHPSRFHIMDRPEARAALLEQANCAGIDRV